MTQPPNKDAFTARTRDGEMNKARKTGGVGRVKLY